MSKMSEVMPKWGPYSKKYSGVSRVTEHETEKGVRFDFISLPAVSNTDAKAPNVTIPVGVHPWDVKSDYSFYSYRQDLEWKDVIYSDVSFTKLSDESVLVRTEIFNNSELMQNCLVNYFSSLQFPFLTSYRVSLPNKSLMFDALDYSEFTYKTSRPWDNETMDAMHKGEFFDDRFTSHRGLGDRDDNRYILPKYPRLGEEKGDKIVYKIKNDLNFSDAALYVRYRTVDNKPSAFTVNGDNVVFPPAQDMGEITMPIGNVDKGDYTLVLVSEGEGGIEFDFFAICEKDETNKILVEAKKNNFVPDVKARDEINGKTVEIKYEGVEKPFVLRTFNDETRLRSIPSGCLEDVPTPRISQPDKSFDNMMETFSGEFSWKHSDEGYYQNTLVHTLYIEPGKSHTEYAVISYGGAEYETPEDDEGFDGFSDDELLVGDERDNVKLGAFDGSDLKEYVKGQCEIMEDAGRVSEEFKPAQIKVIYEAAEADLNLEHYMNPKFSILIIEDEEAIAELEKDYLEISDFEVTIENDGEKGLKTALSEEFDLIILDLMLPGIDGYEICKQIRNQKNIPIIMVSAKKDDIDKIRGLGLGADDYMTKPFSPSELVARVKAHLSRYERLIGSNQKQNDIVEIRGIKIDKTARRVYVDGEEKVFTTKEFDLLTFLAENPNHVFTKDELFREIWDMDSVGDIATVTVHIKKIREKIEYDTSKPQYIETIWGVGYRFKV